MCCPVGPYYKTGFAPVRLMCETEAARSWTKGTGDKKLGCNYGPTVKYSERIQELGYQQVMWLTDDKWVSEVGSMNIFFFWKNKDGEKELVTPVLDGSILPGITRDSVLVLYSSFPS
jgi:branched-chain amino acid aminotransferase